MCRCVHGSRFHERKKEQDKKDAKHILKWNDIR